MSPFVSFVHDPVLFYCHLIVLLFIYFLEPYGLTRYGFFKRAYDYTINTWQITTLYVCPSAAVAVAKSYYLC